MTSQSETLSGSRAAEDSLERFAALHMATFRTKRAPIDLSYPNPRVHRDERALIALRDLVGRVRLDELQYTPFGGRTVTRRRIAAGLARRFGIPYAFRDVFLVPGATAALRLIFGALFSPGDEVLFAVPGWMDYPVYLSACGLRAVPVALGEDKHLDLRAIASSIGPRTAGLIISQPACPTGVVYRPAELAELAEILCHMASRHGRHLLLVSDEAHRDTVWGEEPLHSPAEFYPQTATVYSFGKAWSLQGQRTGYAALHPCLADHDDAVRTTERALRTTGFCAPTALMQLLVTELADLVPDTQTLRRDQEDFRSRLADLGYQPCRASATSFVYVRCPDELGDDREFVEQLAARGLLAMPSSVFHEPGYFRLALNEPADRFDEITQRLGAVLRTDA
jgi:aspartate aminotransferase